MLKGEWGSGPGGVDPYNESYMIGTHSPLAYWCVGRSGGVGSGGVGGIPAPFSVGSKVKG